VQTKDSGTNHVRVNLWLTLYTPVSVERAFENAKWDWLCQPAPMNHVKIFKGLPPRHAPSKLVQLWYKTFPLDHGVTLFY